jgi:hypothetical protein
MYLTCYELLAVEMLNGDRHPAFQKRKVRSGVTGKLPVGVLRPHSRPFLGSVAWRLLGFRKPKLISTSGM